jgi:Fe-S cluster biogenesis protein NfuA
MSGDVDLDRVGRRVEQLLDEVAAADPTAATAASDLVSELLGLYGAGLGRVLAMIDDLAPGVAARLTEDPLVAGLFTLHDLHPIDVVTRVEEALDVVRPYLGSHGGDVELVGVEDDVVQLRLIGSCNGCGASASTLETAVEGAIREAAPEIASIEVEGAVEPAATTSDGLIPLSSLSIRRGANDENGSNGSSGSNGAGGWTTLDVSQVQRALGRA